MTISSDAVPARFARAGRRPSQSLSPAQTLSPARSHVLSGARPRVVVALGLAVLLALVGCSSGHGSTRRSSAPSDVATYGTLPSFLPTSSVDADSVLTGDAARPALTTEGDSVRVRLGGTTVLATVTGPVVPGEGLPEQTESTTCTWTVALSHASSRVPVRIADFTTLDHLGTVYRTHLAPGSHTPPTTLVPGATASFSLRTVMPTGEGLMRWTAGGAHIVASWDFEVEND